MQHCEQWITEHVVIKNKLALSSLTLLNSRQRRPFWAFYVTWEHIYTIFCRTFLNTEHWKLTAVVVLNSPVFRHFLSFEFHDVHVDRPIGTLQVWWEVRPMCPYRLTAESSSERIQICQKVWSSIKSQAFVSCCISTMCPSVCLHSI